MEKSLALEIKKNELLSKELFDSHDSINCLKSANADLSAKIVELNKCPASTVEHVDICTTCKDFDVDACNDHISTIAKLNDDIIKLSVQLKTYNNELEKLKFARGGYTSGRHPSIKDGLGFQNRTKDKKSHEAPKFIKEKGKAPMASSTHSSHVSNNHTYTYANVKNVHNAHNACVDHVVHAVHYDIYSSHAMIASTSSSFAHDRSRQNVSYARSIHVPKARNASYSPSISYHTFDASYVLYCKSSKVVAANVGPKCKIGKTCVWVPKVYVTNLTGPNSSWVPKPFCRFMHPGAQAALLIVDAHAQTKWQGRSRCSL
jgi:hypothetical protein